MTNGPIPGHRIERRGLSAAFDLSLRPVSPRWGHFGQNQVVLFAQVK
ncbi:MAG: hypothetical protein OEO79_01065 [Gemmatimonadota bacterium]|nr:hypothetical protein [Gemmatimonadota bacterium]